MVEIKNLVEERRSSAVFGAVAFIRNGAGQVLTFRETENKPKTGKRAGDLSVLCETREPDETPDFNFLRGVHEELGISYNEISDVLDLNNIITWETGFMDGVWANIYVVNCTDQEKLESLIGSLSTPDGVEIAGWKTRAELESSPVRVGVRNILDKFADEIFE